MSTRQGYFNRDNGKWVDSEGRSEYSDESLPYVRRREELTFQLNVLKTNPATGDTEQYDGWATGGPYTYRFFVDNDYVNYIIGELQTAITAGPITQIKIDNLDISNGSPLSTGRIVLTNTSGQSETISYTAYTLAGGVYTFTVSATASYSYSIDDEAKVVEPSLIEAENTDIDQTDKNTGILVITMDANNQAFTNAADDAASAEITGCLFELQVLDGSAKVVDTISGDFRCLNLLVDDFAEPPPGPTSNHYTKAETDALVGAKIPKLVAGTPGNAVQIAADGETIEDAGVTPGGGGGSGDVVGPASATDNAVARFDTTTGKLIQNSLATIDDSGNIATPADISADSATFAGSATVDDDAYGAGWNGNFTVPTKNAVYDKVEALDAEKLDEDLTALTAKTNPDGSEIALVDDAGTNKTISLSAIGDYVISDKLPDVDFTNGITTSANDLGNDDHGRHVAFIRTKTTAIAQVVALLHMDGSNGDSTFIDDSTFGHTISKQGDPLISNTQEFTGFGTCAHLDGNDGLDLPVTNFDPQATDWGFACKAYIATANINDYMPLLHIGTGTTTKRVLYLYLNSGTLYFKIGTTAGAGDWTDQDSVEVVTAGYLNADAWNSFVFQRSSNSLIVGLNGVIVMRIDMTSKTLNTPDGASKIRFGYDIDAGSSPDNFLTGYMDEIILLDGAPFDATITGSPFATFDDWTLENYVTKKYDVDTVTGDGAYRTTFVNGDLSAGVLTVQHNLNETVVVVGVYDNSNNMVIPDDITLTDANNLDVDLSSFGTLTGTWRVVVISGGYGAGYSDNGVTEIVTDATTSRTLSLDDSGKVIRMTSGSANTVTIPTNASVAFPVGQIIIIRQSGAGATTVTASSTVTLNGVTSPSTGGALDGQYKDVMLQKVDTDTWEAIGAIGAVS